MSVCQHSRARGRASLCACMLRRALSLMRACVDLRPAGASCARTTSPQSQRSSTSFRMRLWLGGTTTCLRSLRSRQVSASSPLLPLESQLNNKLPAKAFTSSRLCHCLTIPNITPGSAKIPASPEHHQHASTWCDLSLAFSPCCPHRPK